LNAISQLLHRPGETYDANKVHEDIKYSEEDDKAIDEWIADHVETTWHSLGTCGEWLTKFLPPSLNEV
jgi:alcohol oxidase